MNIYLENLNNVQELNHEKFEELRNYATIHHVPIIQRDSLVLLQGLIKLQKVKRILEIGTAIGYSALGFVNESNDVIVDTIERDEQMYQEAVKNIKNFGKEAQINVYFEDALEIDINKLAEYDLIFIDAAKAQYTKFFEKFTPLLKARGIVATDNIVFHGCVENQENLSRNVRSMVRKIDAYNHYLSNVPGFKTYYLDSGDGLALSIKESK